MLKQTAAKTNQAKRKSSRARGKQTSKKESPISRVFGFHGRSWLGQTVSIHHLEPSDACLVGTGASATVLKASEDLAARDFVDYWGHIREALKHGVFHKGSGEARKASEYQNLMDSDQLNKDISCHQLKDCVDVLELLNINKKLFVKILQGSEVGIASHFHSPQIKLTKSVSFPTADLARFRNFKPSKLEHKLNEIWSFPKREKLFPSTPAPKLVASKSLNHLEDTKRRGENASEESTKQRNHRMRRSLSTNENELDERRKSTIGKDGENKLRTDNATDNPDNERREGRVYSTRSSFPDDSLERYAQLFEHGFCRDSRWHHSKSLRVTNEKDFSSEVPGGRTTRRNLSLPNFNFYSPQPNDSSYDVIGSGTPSSSADLPSGAEEFIALEAALDGSDSVDLWKSYHHQEQKRFLPGDAVAAETQHIKEIVECPLGLTVGKIDEDGLNENMGEPVMQENSFSQEQDINMMRISSTGPTQPSPCSVLETCFPDDIITPAKSRFSEGNNQSSNTCLQSASDSISILTHFMAYLIMSGSGLKPRRIDFDDSDTLIDSEDRSSPDEVREAEFNYVRDVLELSGLTGKEFLDAWHLLDKMQLSSSVFDEMEACLPQEPQCSGQEVSRSIDHQLLFDLVNQALLEIYQRSVTYCPKALSYSCRVRPIPVGHHVIEAVWASIRCGLSSAQHKEVTLNDVVAGDLARDDGWMNLQSETESLALEMEDIIFNQLLDEMLFS